MIPSAMIRPDRARMASLGLDGRMGNPEAGAHRLLHLPN